MLVNQNLATKIFLNERLVSLNAKLFPLNLTLILFLSLPSCLDKSDRALRTSEIKRTLIGKWEVIPEDLEARAQTIRAIHTARQSPDLPGEQKAIQDFVLEALRDVRYELEFTKDELTQIRRWQENVANETGPYEIIVRKEEEPFVIKWNKPKHKNWKEDTEKETLISHAKIIDENHLKIELPASAATVSRKPKRYKFLRWRKMGS